VAEIVTVASIETVQFSAPLIAPVRYGKIERTKSASVVVRLRSSDGVIGYGEACAVPQLTGESAESIVSLVDLYLRTLIVGTDVLAWRRTMADIRKRFPKSFVGLAAVETAFLDLVGKFLKVPAYAVIGAKYRDRVELCASISWDRDAGKMADDASEKARLHRTLKVYVGPDDLTSDLKRLEAVRNAVDASVRMMLDVKGLWSAATAIEVAPILRNLGIFLVEQPVAPEDRSGAAAVTRVYQDQFGILSAADEAVETPAQVAQLAHAREFSSLNLGVTKMGGPEIALRSAHVAHAVGIPVLVGSFAELGIATAAGLHLAAAIPELVAPSYLSGPERFTETITMPVLLPDAGFATVPQGAGLGIAVDDEKIERMATRR
jgi:muconate cycloisomerase